GARGIRIYVHDLGDAHAVEAAGVVRVARRRRCLAPRVDDRGTRDEVHRSSDKYGGQSDEPQRKPEPRRRPPLHDQRLSLKHLAFRGAAVLLALRAEDHEARDHQARHWIPSCAWRRDSGALAGLDTHAGKTLRWSVAAPRIGSSSVESATARARRYAGGTHR